MGAWLLYFLVMIVIYVGAVLAGVAGGALLVLIAGQMGGAMKLVTGLVVLAYVIVVLCGFFYIDIRLSFLLGPVTVAEQRLSLIRAWQLGQGNFWRMFAVFLSFFIPLLVLEFGFIYAMYGNAFLPPLHATPDEMAAFMRHQQEVSRQAMMMSQKFWYIVYPAGLLFGVIFYALISGAGAFAYKALVPAGVTSDNPAV
jgi:hypothetical protein